MSPQFWRNVACKKVSLTTVIFCLESNQQVIRFPNWRCRVVTIKQHVGNILDVLFGTKSPSAVQLQTNYRRYPDSQIVL